MCYQWRYRSLSLSHRPRNLNLVVHCGYILDKHVITVCTCVLDNSYLLNIRKNRFLNKFGRIVQFWQYLFSQNTCIWHLLNVYIFPAQQLHECLISNIQKIANEKPFRRTICCVWRSYMFCLQTWWRHPMETFFVLLSLCAGNSPVTGELPAKGPVTRSFDVVFDLHLIKRLSKQSRRRWFETPLRLLWRHCNGY